MKLVIIHQYDPTIPSVGGIGTYINAFIRNAPDDAEIDFIGVTSQPDKYPVGKWQQLTEGRKSFRFFPLVAANPVHVKFVPLTLRMLWALFRYSKTIDIKDAIIESHRIEPMLAFLGSRNAKILFFHGNNLKDFYNKKTEVRWGRFPWLYFWLEKKLLPLSSHIYMVREDATLDYMQKYPNKAHEISFLPTWVDDEIFYSLGEQQRQDLREHLSRSHGIPAGARIFLFVGRYEGQKDPLRLLDAFRTARAKMNDAVLILIGEGNLKSKMQQFVKNHDLCAVVRFLPPMGQNEIARWMNASDVLCLSSAFEGMPFVILEALFCGLPVVSTAVGETTRLLGNQEGGLLVFEDSAEAFAEQMVKLVKNPPSRETCRKQAEPYTAEHILAPVYEYHRQLSRHAF